MGPSPDAYSFSKVLRETQKVAVGVLHQKLPVTSLLTGDPIPGIVTFPEERPLCLFQSIEKWCDGADKDLEVDTAPQWPF